MISTLAIHRPTSNLFIIIFFFFLSIQDQTLPSISMLLFVTDYLNLKSPTSNDMASFAAKVSTKQNNMGVVNFLNSCHLIAPSI